MKRNTFLKSLLGLPLLFSSKSLPANKKSVVEFTPELIRKYNYGIYIILDKVDIVKNPDYAKTVCWKLTWNLGIAVNNINGVKTVVKEFPKYSLTNFLTDGWTYPVGYTEKEVCDYLNNSKDKYRIMTKEEIIYLLEHTSNKQLFHE